MGRDTVRFGVQEGNSCRVESALGEQAELEARRVRAHCQSHQDLDWSVCEDAVAQPDSSEVEECRLLYGGHVDGGEGGW